MTWNLSYMDGETTIELPDGSCLVAGGVFGRLKPNDVVEIRGRGKFRVHSSNMFFPSPGTDGAASMKLILDQQISDQDSADVAFDDATPDPTSLRRPR